jgi:hypothetical protein
MPCTHALAAGAGMACMAGMLDLKCSARLSAQATSCLLMLVPAVSAMALVRAITAAQKVILQGDRAGHCYPPPDQVCHIRPAASCCSLQFKQLCYSYRRQAPAAVVHAHCSCWRGWCGCMGGRLQQHVECAQGRLCVDTQHQCTICTQSRCIGIHRVALRDIHAASAFHVMLPGDALARNHPQLERADGIFLFVGALAANTRS